jgi:hypothetical protein
MIGLLRNWNTNSDFLPEAIHIGKNSFEQLAENLICQVVRQSKMQNDFLH